MLTFVEQIVSSLVTTTESFATRFRKEFALMRVRWSLSTVREERYAVEDEDAEEEVQ